MKPKTSFLVFAALVMIVAASTMSLKKRSGLQSAMDRIAAYYSSQISQFDSALAAYPQYFLDSSYVLRVQKYGELAYTFKTVEGLFTYFHPKLAYESFLKTAQFEKRDVGPPLPDNWIWLGPFGISPDSVLKKKNAQDSAFEKMFISRAVTNMRSVLKTCGYEKDFESSGPPEIFNALRLQMVRMSTVGLANGDMVIEEAGMPSLEGAFDAWIKVTGILAEALPSSSKGLKEQVALHAEEGRKMLYAKPGMYGFDRMAFLKRSLIPLSQDLAALQKALRVDPLKTTTALRPGAAHVYEASVFNADYFAPGEEACVTTSKVNLGRFLFFDPILSNNNQRACASCHRPEKAFTDGFAKSLNFEKGDLPRNAPTVINAAFQKDQFWDLRSSSLEDQLDSVINSTDEMHSSFESVIERINSSPEYMKLFADAFPETKKKGVQRKHVKIAIACYERQLTGMDSRFDRYVRGDEKAMNQEEIHGFNLFMGKAKCGSCHYAPLFSGALPPYFDFTDHRSLGVPLKDTMEVYAVDGDMGVAKLRNNPFYNFSFKVPTVRNAALTAPYMHNGVYKTLEQVVNFYDHAGGDKFFAQMRPGLKGLPFFMILPQELKLSVEEKQHLVAFIHTLTDSSSAKNVPTYLPQLKGRYAHLNERRVGGVY